MGTASKADLMWNFDPQPEVHLGPQSTYNASVMIQFTTSGPEFFLFGKEFSQIVVQELKSTD
jgi:hypothetical protein